MSDPPPGLHEFAAEVRLTAAADPEELLGPGFAALLTKALERQAGTVRVEVKLDDLTVTIRMHLLHESTPDAVVLAALSQRGQIHRLAQGIKFDNVNVEVKPYGT